MITIKFLSDKIENDTFVMQVVYITFQLSFHKAC